jgi:acyl-CoA thioester hydrolase
MPRIQLEPKSNYGFKAEMTVRTTDLNYGGHLGNDRLLSLVHEARVAFLASYEWSEMNCAGVGLIMSDTAIVFQNEAFAGEKLVFEVSMGEASKIGFRIFNRITRSLDDQDIALVENGMVCFNYDQRKVCPLPDAVRDICDSLE